MRAPSSTERRAPSAAVVLLLVACAAGCWSKTTRVSHDADANYGWVFSQMPEPRPQIVHSWLERYHRCCGLPGERNGEWQFELHASRSWLNVLLRDFHVVDWSESDVKRYVQPWFTPKSAEYTLWRLEGGSYPLAHVCVERKPADETRVHVFVRRH